MRSASIHSGALPWLLMIATACPVIASAQGLPPPVGGGAVNVTFQAIENTGHLLTDGTYIDNGRSRSGSLFFEVDYGLTRRFSLSFGLPFVFARFTDDDPPPPFIPFLPVDQCRCWHGGWQDVNVTARFTWVDTLDHVLVVTPSIALGAPSHAYEYQGEAVIGHRLHEVRLAVDIVARLDAISPRLSVNGRYGYALVEDVIDVSTDRSNLWLGGNWRATPALSVRGFAAWQRTHGGLRGGSPFDPNFPPPGDVTTPERVVEHDRLLRDNRTHLGVGASYQFPRLELFGTYTRFVTGTDSHAGYAFTTGISWPFRDPPLTDPPAHSRLLR